MPATKKSNAGPFGDRLREARNRIGMPMDVASVRVRDILGSSYGPSRETIRRYESGFTTEDTADPMVIAALAELYDVDVAWISPSIARQVENIHLLAGRSLSRKPNASRRSPTRRKPKSDSGWIADVPPAGTHPVSGHKGGNGTSSGNRVGQQVGHPSGHKVGSRKRPTAA